MLKPIILSVENLVVEYGDRPSPIARALHRPTDGYRAVNDVSFTVPRHGAVGIVGESGSGKSTILRAIMGLTPIASGNVRYEGHIINMDRRTTRNAGIQMVFQDPGTALDPMMTVGQTLGEVLRVHHLVPRSQVEARIRDLIDMVALPSKVVDARPADLSGGQKQRAAIARALAFQPKLLIGDEPTSALDVVVQAQVLDLLRQLRKETGLSLLIVTHNLDLVRYVCDEAIVIHHGVIDEQGTAWQLFHEPKATYTRELLAAAPAIRR